MTLLAIRDVKVAIERAEKAEDAPKGPLAELVGDVLAEVLLERIARRTQDAADGA